MDNKRFTGTDIANMFKRGVLNEEEDQELRDRDKYSEVSVGDYYFADPDGPMPKNPKHRDRLENLIAMVENQPK